MAIESVGKNNDYWKVKLQGLTADVKPVLNNSQSGSTFMEVDGAKRIFIWHTNAWYEL